MPDNYSKEGEILVSTVAVLQAVDQVAENVSILDKRVLFQRYSDKFPEGVGKCFK